MFILFFLQSVICSDKIKYNGKNTIIEKEVKL